VGHAIDHRRTEPDWIVTIEIRVIIRPTLVVVIAETRRVIAPARITRANEERCGAATPMKPFAVGASHRRRVIWVVGAGDEAQCEKDSNGDGTDQAKMFLHGGKTLRATILFEWFFNDFFILGLPWVDREAGFSVPFRKLKK
jgi:hypothetical protein